MKLLLLQTIGLTEVFINPRHVVKITVQDKGIVSLVLSDQSIYSVELSANKTNIKKLIAEDWVDFALDEMNSCKPNVN